MSYCKKRRLRESDAGRLQCRLREQAALSAAPPPPPKKKIKIRLKGAELVEVPQLENHERSKTGQIFFPDILDFFQTCHCRAHVSRDL